MPRIVLTKDNLDERNAEFEQTPLKRPLFVNSVPKCGTHLIRNIMRMFVPVPQHYTAAFVQISHLDQHKRAFSAEKPMLSWGHLLFSDDSAILTRQARQILMVRDPYDFVLARARFFMSENFTGTTENLKNDAVDVSALLNLMILGIHRKAPGLEEMFRHNALGWLGTSAYLVRYEDMVRHVKNLASREAELYFMRLFHEAGIDPVPADWRKRVEIGGDRKQSSTARENLTGAADLPDELPEMQKKMVNYVAPGLREMLGYY